MASEKSNEKIGVLTTFYEMVGGGRKECAFDKILIPKIQRDYAQGRVKRKKLRENFLTYLYRAIDSPNAEKCEIDYIYGQKEEKENEFSPIDGQQRLTTLFLLHLYISKRAEINGTDAENLKKFSYETRDSSKQFCNKLHQIETEHYVGIKQYIENQWWYTSRWENDPTINSMLVVLNDIDEHYREKSKEDLSEIWERLKTNITFWRLNLEDLNTTDDLYIKMNSRGKLLTDFEHFKAQIESYMKGDENENLPSEFSNKIDTKWTNLLWDYRNKENDGNKEKYVENGLDKKFINLLRRFMIIEGTKKGLSFSELGNKDVLDLAETVINKTPEIIDRFTSIMDFFCGQESVTKFFENILTYESQESLESKGQQPSLGDYRVNIGSDELGESVDYLGAVVNELGSFSYRKYLMLEAFFEYASKRDKCKFDIRDRIRIVRNLVFNSDNELRAERMKPMIECVDKIMCDDFEFESFNNSNDAFNTFQTMQEIDKFKWLMDHPDDEIIIKCAENHSLLMGNLSAYMSSEGECHIENMRKHTELFHKDVGYTRIIRALLTIGDYAHEYGDRKKYGGLDPKNWRDDIFTYGNENTPPILSKLYETLSGISDSNVDAYSDSSVDAHIDTWLKKQEDKSEYTWEYYMVKYDGMRHGMRYGSKGTYIFASDFKKYDFYMMNKDRFSGYHWNPYLYCLNNIFTNSSIGYYNAPLEFDKEGIRITADENSYMVAFADGRTDKWAIPQNEEGIDTVDRIIFAKNKIEDLIKSIDSLLN